MHTLSSLQGVDLSFVHNSPHLVVQNVASFQRKILSLFYSVFIISEKWGERRKNNILHSLERSKMEANKVVYLKLRLGEEKSLLPKKQTKRMKEKKIDDVFMLISILLIQLSLQGWFQVKVNTNLTSLTYKFVKKKHDVWHFQKYSEI